MNIYGISDLHLSEGTEKPMDVFGSDWDRHTERLKENWDAVVSGEDAVIISGDVSWGLQKDEVRPDFEWLHARPGLKIISKGNHDLWWTSPNKMNRLYDDIQFVQNNCIILDDTAICGTRGWGDPQHSSSWTEHDDKIFRREQIRLKMSLESAAAAGSRSIILSMHYPPLYKDGMDTEYSRIIHQYPVTCVLFGHLHGKKNASTAFQGMRKGISYRLMSSDIVEFKPQFILSTNQAVHDTEEEE